MSTKTAFTTGHRMHGNNVYYEWNWANIMCKQCTDVYE